MIRTIASLLLVAFPVVARADNWPQWRGPTNNGVSTETGVPTAWGEGKNVVWKLKMPGAAGSTPAIWGDRIFLTSAEGKDLLAVCVSTDGKILWKKTVANTSRGAIRKDEANDAGASPSTDGKRAYFYFGTGDLVCFDFDGKELWKRNMQVDFGKFSIQHGMHISPLLHENRLYVVLLTNGGHWIVSFDAATGKEIWRHNRASDARGESREAYSSPILWTTGKEPCVVVLGCDYTTAHRLDNGNEIWRLVDLNPASSYSTALRIIATPVATSKELVVPTARGGIIIGMKPGATGIVDPKSPFELWRKTKGAPDVPSPLIKDGLLYIARENGILLVWDAKTGEELYSERLHADRYRSSPVTVDGNVIANSRDGTFHVVKTGPTYHLVSRNNLDDTFTASPAISGGRIYLRGFEHLYAIGAK